MNVPDRAYAYARTSPGTNEDETSLDGQCRQLESWADDNGVDLVEVEQDGEMTKVVEDEDVSGRKVAPLDRPGFSLIAEDMMRSEVTVVVAKTKDRFSRSVVHLFSLEEVLGRVYETQWNDYRDYRCMTIEGEDLDYSLPDDPHEAMEHMSDNMMDMFMAFMASMEANKTARKTSNALQQKNDDDQPVGRLPYGLTSDKQKWGRSEAQVWLPKDGRGQDEELDDINPDEDEFGTVISILNEFGFEGPDSDETPSAYSVGKEHGLSSPSSMVKKMWDKRERYRQVAQNHRPDLEIDF